MRTLMAVFSILSLILFIGTGQAIAASFVSSEVALSTPTGDLFGTMLAPENASEQVPVVLLIAGSGPTDRNGNTAMFPGGNNSLKQLAEGLADFGVASLRYDKRGIAASAGAAVSERQLRFSQSIDDARRWCDLLTADQRFSCLVVAGHSQGSLVGMNAAWEAGAHGFVSMAGAGRPLCDILRTQLRSQLPIRSRVEAERVLSQLEKGCIVEEPPTELTILFRPSVQPFLISWQQHNPVQDIAKLQVPVLIIQGTTDLQVDMEDAELLADASPAARLVKLEGYNHILKPVAGDNPVLHQLALVDSTLVVSPEAVAALVQLTRDAESALQANSQRHSSVMLFNLGLTIDDTAKKIEENLVALGEESVAHKVAFWARYFEDREDIVYCFGPGDGGYVAQGSLVLDRRQDCVSLVYRCSELARSETLAESVDWALRTRFAGAQLASFTGESGNVDYDHPAHLDFSLDMIRSGIWGADITESLSGVQADAVGTSRYEAGSFSYVATDSLVSSELQDGDVVWLVLDPSHNKGAQLRDEYGLVIGHIGLVILEGDEPWLVHAASSDLSDQYKGGTVVKVPLAVYLDRVDQFYGLMVTRFMAE